VCISLYTIVIHNTALNSSDKTFIIAQMLYSEREGGIIIMDGQKNYKPGQLYYHTSRDIIETLKVITGKHIKLKTIPKILSINSTVHALMLFNDSNKKSGRQLSVSWCTACYKWYSKDRPGSVMNPRNMLQTKVDAQCDKLATKLS